MHVTSFLQVEHCSVVMRTGAHALVFMKAGTVEELPSSVLVRVGAGGLIAPICIGKRGGIFVST